MNDEEYRKHCMALLVDFAETLAGRTRDLPEDHPLKALSEEYQSLADPANDVYRLGPDLVATLFNTFTEFAPTFPRQLLWFLGGDCLHYLTDEEIAQFQQLEDMRVDAARRGEIFKLEEARAKLLNLH
jgi:hypothetical protein